MPKEIIPATIKLVVPTPNGTAVFLGVPGKVFVITVDQSLGSAILMAMQGTKRERPLTHDLLMNAFQGFGVEVSRVVINQVNDQVFFARLILTMQNELGKKIVELDARPSDSIVIALQARKPIFVARTVLDQVEDMSDAMRRWLKEQEE